MSLAPSLPMVTSTTTTTAVTSSSSSYPATTSSTSRVPPLRSTFLVTPPQASAPIGSQTDRGPFRSRRLSGRSRRDSTGGGGGGVGLMSSGPSASRFHRGRRLHESRASLFHREPVAAAAVTGIYGGDVDVGYTELQASEARMNAHVGEMQTQNLEEIKKLATRLRTSYDDLKLQCKQKTLDIQSVQAELQVFERMATASKTAEAFRIDARIKEAGESLEDSRARLEKHSRTKDVYHHMIDRLKIQITDEIQSVKAMQKLADATKLETKEAHVTVQAAKVERGRAEALVLQLKRQLEIGREQREDKMASLDQLMEVQEMQRMQFEERERRRLNIPHLPRGDLNEEEEARLKRLYLVRQIYGKMLLRKLREEQKQCDKLEAAFQKIRQATGLTDVEEIVEKFLTRASTFEQLQAQQLNARDRIDALRAEKASLSQALDSVATERGLGNENRVLYQKIEEYDRRLHESERRCTEAKERCIRVSITLEETRACVEKLLTKVDPSAAETLSALPKFKDQSLRASATSLLSKDHNTSVTVSALETALSRMDDKLTSHMAYLAAVFEREEQSIHRQALGAATGESKISEKDKSSADAGLQASKSGALNFTGKASERVFKNLMSIEPDTTETNVRVSIRSHSPIRPREYDEDSVDQGDEPLSRLLSGVGVGSVVERDSLKRLSAMMTDRKQRSRARGPVPRTHSTRSSPVL